MRDLTVKKHFKNMTTDAPSSISNGTPTQELNFQGAHILPLKSELTDHAAILSLISLQEESWIINEEEEMITDTSNQGRIPNPSFYPIQSRSSAMNLFQSMVEIKLTNLLSVPSIDDRGQNLTYKERQALKSLRDNPHIPSV